MGSGQGMECKNRFGKQKSSDSAWQHVGATGDIAMRPFAAARTGLSQLACSRTPVGVDTEGGVCAANAERAVHRQDGERAVDAQYRADGVQADQAKQGIDAEEAHHDIHGEQPQHRVPAPRGERGETAADRQVGALGAVAWARCGSGFAFKLIRIFSERVVHCGVSRSQFKAFCEGGNYGRESKPSPRSCAARAALESGPTAS
mmetsp:Transcript_21416/g.59462  ORF Transcript_21416/g.59462 Transcript_21416/m.59462 type:complete len:203 (+) Transcript_21416:68-676(+)